jgi:iron complex outermembrane receptor protein
VKPEALLDVELGAGFADGDTRLGANIYWMEFTDEIVKSGQIDRFGQPITGNAERTRHTGLEVSGKIPLTSALEFNATATVSRNRFVRHFDYSTGSPVSLAQNPIAGFPDFMANMRLTARLANFTGSISARYVGKQYTDNFKNEMLTVDPYLVSDLSASYRIDGILDDVSIEAKLQVNNVFDALYAAYGEGTQFFVGAERNLFFNLTVNL